MSILQELFIHDVTESLFTQPAHRVNELIAWEKKYIETVTRKPTGKGGAPEELSDGCIASLTGEIIFSENGPLNESLKLALIHDALFNRYHYDMTKNTISKDLPDWVLASPLFNGLKELYERKIKAGITLPPKNWKDKGREAKKAVLGVLQNAKKVVLGSLDVLLKGADLVDDVIGAMQRSKLLGGMSDLAQRAAIGGIQIFLHGYNACKGFYDAYKAIKEEKNSRTKFVKVFTGLAKGIYGIAGVTTGVLLIVGTFIGAVVSTPIAMFVSTLLMLGNFVCELCKNVRVFNKAEQKKTIDKEKLNNTELQKFKKGQWVVEQDVLDKSQNSLLQSQSQSQSQSKATFKEQEQEIAKGENTIYEKLYQYSQEELQYKLSKQDLRNAEREIGFSATEVVTGTIVLASTTIGLLSFGLIAALIGISAATFGIAPFAIAVLGVTAGLVLKTLQLIDDVNDHKPSKFIRDSFHSFSNWVKGKPAKIDKIKKMSSWEMIVQQMNLNPLSKPVDEKELNSFSYSDAPKNAERNSRLENVPTMQNMQNGSERSSRFQTPRGGSTASFVVQPQLESESEQEHSLNDNPHNEGTQSHTYSGLK